MNTSKGVEVTGLGTLVLLLLAVTTSRGPWGLFVAFVLAVAIISVALTHYQTLTGYLIKGG